MQQQTLGPLPEPLPLPAPKGAQFPQWNGSLLIGGMGSQSISRVTFDGKGGAAPAERWAVAKRIRDIAVAADGAIWVIEDTSTGGLYKLTPVKK